MSDGLHTKAENYEGKTVAIKLISDSNQLIELAGEYVGQTETMVRLRHLYALTPMDNGKGGFNMGFVDFMVLGEPGSIVELYKRTIVGMQVAKPAVAKQIEEFKKPNKVEAPKIIL